MSTKIYKSYVFKTKDPVIDELRTILQDEYGTLKNGTLAKVEKSGGPSQACMRAWFFGVTKRPQSASIEACGRAAGYRRKWVKDT